jgi:uncharacterized protein YggE
MSPCLGWLSKATRQTLQTLAVGLITLGALLASSAAPAMAWDRGFPCPPPHELPTIRTSGQGKVTVSPDSFRASANVRSQAKNLLEARKDNQAKVQSILANLKALKIERLQLKTTGFNVNPVYETIPGNSIKRLPKVIGYQAITNIEIKGLQQTQDVLADNASRALDAAMNGGAEDVGGLQFFIDNQDAVQRQALTKAVESAVANAKAMAAAAGVSAPTAFTLDGSPQFESQPMYMPYARTLMADGMAMAEKSMAPPVEVGETTVTATVSAVFHFIDGNGCPVMSRMAACPKSADGTAQACPKSHPCPDKPCPGKPCPMGGKNCPDKACPQSVNKRVP